MTYRRPELELGIYLDEFGVPIPYGRRWGMGSPPDVAYSVCAHPERFAPVTVVAQALVDYVIDAYDVDVADTARLPGWLDVAEIGSTSYPMSVTRLAPRDPESAPLTVVETAHPAVVLIAGAATSETFPQCGCDACDSGILDVVESLEDHVFAVLEGNFQEEITKRRVSHTWTMGEGDASGWMPRRLAEADDVTELIRARRHLGAVWQPWPVR